MLSTQFFLSRKKTFLLNLSFIKIQIPTELFHFQHGEFLPSPTLSISVDFIYLVAFFAMWDFLVLLNSNYN